MNKKKVIRFSMMLTPYDCEDDSSTEKKKGWDNDIGIS